MNNRLMIAISLLALAGCGMTESNAEKACIRMEAVDGDFRSKRLEILLDAGVEAVAANTMLNELEQLSLRQAFFGSAKGYATAGDWGHAACVAIVRGDEDEAKRIQSLVILIDGSGPGASAAAQVEPAT